MARKIVTPTTATTTATPANGTPVATIALVANATGVNWAYPAQAPTGGKGRGVGPGSVGAALLQALANGPITLAAAQAAVTAQAQAKNLRGAHPVQPLCRYIAVHGGIGLGFACVNGMLSMGTYQAPTQPAQ